MNMSLSYLAVYLVQLPLYLVWLVGIILSIVFWKKHPTVSLLSLIALAGLLIISIVDVYASTWLPIALRSQGMSTGRISIEMGIISVSSSFVSTAFWILLVIALFGWRKGREENQLRN
jgi:hypothetical protein